MRIHCPHCGERDQSEFAYLGDATLRRPPETAGADAYVDYVYIRDNPAGPHRERWYHAFGCRGWLDVERDVRTHRITAITLARPDDGGRA